MFNDNKLIALLVGSLLVNAFLGGFTISYLVRDDGGPPFFGPFSNSMAHRMPPGGMPPMRHGSIPGQDFGRDGEDSDAARGILDRAFAPQRDEIDAAMDEMEASKMQVEGLLAAEAVDKPALETALKKMEAANAAAFGGLEKSLRAAAAMTLDDRKTLVETLEQLPIPGPQGPRWMHTPGNTPP